MTKIYYLRHFQTQSNIKNCWCGKYANVSIDPSFKYQQQLGNLLLTLDGVNFDAVYISPLKRCLETAELLKTLKLPKPKIDQRIIERDFGVLENKPCDFKDKDEMSLWDKNTDLGMNVEKIQVMFFEKTKPFIEDIIKKHKNKNVLVISHSWIGRLLKYYFTHNKEDIKIAPKNGEIILFEVKN